VVTVGLGVLGGYLRAVERVVDLLADGRVVVRSGGGGVREPADVVGGGEELVV
jgi:hypothetical protein